MEKQNIRENIKRKAVEIFSQKGFHGTSIRDIARESGCSLPMLYYYYKSKSDLFDEVAYHEFIRLIERLNSYVKLGGPLEDIYFQAVKQRMELSPYDKGVYKLSMKVWLGLDGSREVREKLTEWEAERSERTKMILSKACADTELLPVFSNIMVRLMENMIEKIIFLDEVIPDEQIRKEISYVLRLVKSK